MLKFCDKIYFASIIKSAQHISEKRKGSGPGAVRPKTCSSGSGSPALPRTRREQTHIQVKSQFYKSNFFPFQILHGEDVGTAADGERGAGAHAG